MADFKESTVPCNGCVTCCKSGSIFLFPEKGDDVTKYKTVEAYDRVHGRDSVMLDHKPNGDCIYLGDKGCTIYEDRPIVCRVFDCRRQFLILTNASKEKFIRAGMTSGKEFDEGKKRQWTLTSAERRECIDIRKQAVDGLNGHKF